MWKYSNTAKLKNMLRSRDLEHTIINPLFGYMFRVNGCLESIRLFSSELKIKYDDREERIYSKDKSKDSLTNLLIQLFPSHTGVLNNFRGTDLNFTNKYFIRNIAYYDETKIDRTANIKMLGSMFARLVKKDEEEIKKVSKKETRPYKLLEYYILSSSTVSGLDNKILKLLAIQAYVVETFDTPDELEIYLNSILESLEGTKNAMIDLELTKEQKQLIEYFYDNPFKFPYSKINQPASNSSIPIYDRKIDELISSERFPDCVDITILHLCNCLFFDDKIDKCTLEHLIESEETQSDELIRLEEFYEKYHYRPFEITYEMRNDWSRVVQGLDDNRAFECQGNYKPYLILCRNQKYRNEIKSGIINIMSVLAKICNAGRLYKKIMTEEQISENSIVEKLTEFFNEICNKNVKITIKGSGIKETAQDQIKDFLGDLKIAFDLVNSKTSRVMKLHISQGHTSFFFEGMKSEVEKAGLTGPEGFKSDGDKNILSLLLSKHIKLFSNNDDKTENFEYPFEVLYNQGALRTNEQKRDQCIHLCEFIDKNKIFDHRITKRIIKNLVKSANLSDPATREIFRPFFIYIDDICERMSNYEVTEIWMSLFNSKSKIKSQSIKNAWNEAVKKSTMKIRGMTFSNRHVYSINSVKTVLSLTKDITKNLKFTSLYLNSEEFTDILQDFLLDNTTLKALAIPQNSLSLTNMLHIIDLLKNNKSLKTLDISSNRFSDEDLKSLTNALENNTSLTAIDMSNIFSEDASGECIVDIIKKNKTLTTLDISHNKNIKSKDIETIAASLENNTTLTTLDISQNNFCKEGIEALAGALKKNTTLTSLIISYSNLNAENIKYLADALKINNTLTTLDISGNYNLGTESIKCIADALEHNTTLTTLNISHICSYENKDEIAKHIARILKLNTTLTSLNISGNDLEAEDAKYIAEALRHNTTLTELDISYNNLQDEGAKYISDIFVENKVLEHSEISSLSGPANKTLTKLNISGDRISNEGGKHLMDAIEKCESLVYLNISHNKFENEGIDYIANALAKNKFLKDLKIQDPQISVKDSRTILDALKENRSLVELNLNYLGSQLMAECIADALKDNRILKTLDILFPYYTSIEDRAFLCNAVEKNTTLEKVTFRKTNDSCIIMSDRMPVENSTDCQSHSKTSEFQSLEIYFNQFDNCF